MTNIATLDDLDNIAVGTTINVTAQGDTQEWVKGDGGLTRNGITLETRTFVGAIDEGHVTTGPVMEVGRWYVEGGGVRAYTLRVDEGNALMLYIYGDGSTTISTWSRVEGGWSRITDTPDDDMFVRGIASMWMRDRERMAQTQTQYETAVNTARADDTQRLRALGSSLQGVLEEFDDEDDRQRMYEWMEDNGMERPGREVEVTVRVDGYTYVTMDSDVAANSIEGGVEIRNVTSAEVTWRHTLTREIETNLNSPCDAVTEAMVREWLEEDEVSYDGFSHEVSCGEC